MPAMPVGKGVHTLSPILPAHPLGSPLSSLLVALTHSLHNGHIPFDPEQQEEGRGGRRDEGWERGDWV